VTRQQRTLVDTSNIVLDEIISGKRDCLLIATTDQPERFDAAIYRRLWKRAASSTFPTIGPTRKT
jgi:transitional endoplasmic reticulum ATPase